MPGAGAFVPSPTPPGALSNTAMPGMSDCPAATSPALSTEHLSGTRMDLGEKAGLGHTPIVFEGSAKHRRNHQQLMALCHPRRFGSTGDGSWVSHLPSNSLSLYNVVAFLNIKSYLDDAFVGLAEEYRGVCLWSSFHEKGIQSNLRRQVLLHCKYCLLNYRKSAVHSLLVSEFDQSVCLSF